MSIANSSAIGSGALTLSGGTIDNTSSGDLTLANNNNWNGNFTYAGSAHNLTLRSASTITLNAAPTVTVSANTLEVGGQITGRYGLTKAGSGALMLASALTANANVVHLNLRTMCRRGPICSPATTRLEALVRLTARR